MSGMKNTFVYIVFGILIVSFLVYKYFTAEGKKTERDVTPDEFEELIKKGDVIIIDVRSAFEYKGDKIKDAINASITSDDFVKKIESLDKDKTYLLYCQVGNRSSIATRMMLEKGFTNVYNLIGGIENWKHSKKPVVR